MNAGLEQIAPFVEKSPEELSGLLEQVFIKVIGHAMAIPVPGFLFQDKNRLRANKNLVYAGTDNGRLPLLLEAVDSGVVATKELYRPATFGM